MTPELVEAHDDAIRQRALRLIAAGLPITAAEFATIQRESRSQFHRKAKRGVYDDLKLKLATGPKSYSGVLVGRYLRGEELQPATFGRRKRA